MNDILITGATGFLGRFICEELKKQALNYHTIGRSLENNIVADLASHKIIANLNYKTVIHCAGKAHIVPKNEDEAKDFFRVNYDGTKVLLGALEKSSTNLHNFIFISTVSVYGISEGCAITEVSPLLAKDPYGKSKVLCEKLLDDWCSSHNVNLIILRIPLLIGRDAPGNLGAMVKGLKKGLYFNIDGGKARKSMVLAEDIAQFIPKIIGKTGVFNLTDGYHPSFLELSEILGQALNRAPKDMPMLLSKLLAISGDIIGRKFPIDSYRLHKIVSTLTFSDQKARDLLDWNPRPVLREIKELFAN